MSKARTPARSKAGSGNPEGGANNKQAPDPPRPFYELIREERLRKKEHWDRENPERARQAGANRYTQENVAGRVPVTLKTYQLWETRREPSPMRLRQIALALDLPEDHFLPTPGSAVPPDLAAELGELKAAVDLLLAEWVELGPLLRALVGERAAAERRRG